MKQRRSNFLGRLGKFKKEIFCGIFIL